MHRSIAAVSKRFIGWRKGEGFLVSLTFAYFFFCIAAYYCVKPVSRASILDTVGAQGVPFADLIVVVLLGPLVAFFGRFTRGEKKSKLVRNSLIVCVFSFLLFGFFFPGQSDLLSIVFYLWVAIFSVFNATLFWLVANDHFRPRQAKRLFGCLLYTSDAADD